MTSRIPIRCGPFHNWLSHSARWSLLLNRPKFNPSNPHSRLLRCFQGSSSARYKSTDSTNPNAQSQSSNNNGSKQQNANESDSSGTKWYIPTIPISVGIATIAILHYRKVYKREQQRVEDELEKGKQGAIVMEGPWQLHLLLSLPLRSLSRLWGHVNNTYTIPTPLRTPLYSLYAWLFDCNLDEMKEKDLKTYKNLGEFFFREIDVQRFRKVDWEVDLISPADGDLIHFGMITPCRHISHIKDHKYSVDILLGHHHPDSSSPAKQATQPRNGSMAKTEQEEQKELLSLASTTHSPEIITHPEKFAEVNTIQYGVSELIGGAVDESDLPSSDSTSATSVKMGGNGKGDVAKTEKTAEKTGLIFAVIYLAPGDYHRFHSPTEWIVKERRHIHGELLSVSPRLLNMVPTLFTLNERVALLGEWKHGFFGMVPVGATNVGSVVVGFDEALRTNLPKRLRKSNANSRSNSSSSSESSESSTPTSAPHTQDASIQPSSLASSPSESTTWESEHHHAVVSHLHYPFPGRPLVRAQEMGGFKLGSTIVLVFEAPVEKWEWNVQRGKVKVGQKLGGVRD